MPQRVVGEGVQLGELFGGELRGLVGCGHLLDSVHVRSPRGDVPCGDCLLCVAEMDPFAHLSRRGGSRSCRPPKAWRRRIVASTNPIVHELTSR